MINVIYSKINKYYICLITKINTMENYTPYLLSEELSHMPQGHFKKEVEFVECIINVAGFMEMEGSKPRFTIDKFTANFEDGDMDMPEESINEVIVEFNEIFA